MVRVNPKICNPCLPRELNMFYDEKELMEHIREKHRRNYIAMTEGKK
jgi:hypothetical protein